MDIITLTEEQLEVFANMQTYIILTQSDKPQPPSEVAKTLQLSANTVHYNVNRLLAVKLLTVITKRGRSKTSQTISTRFRLLKTLLPICDETSYLVTSTLEKCKNISPEQLIARVNAARLQRTLTTVTTLCLTSATA